MVKRISWAVLALLVLLVAAVAVNTLRASSRQLTVPAAPPLAVPADAVADTLSGAIRFRTESSLTDPLANADEFHRFHIYLEQRFPRLHATLQREEVGGFGLLYTWRGTDPAAKPIAIMAHQDVVPIEPGTEPLWQAPPYSGAIRDGYIWGRGSWDDKGNLIAEMQAIEMLIASGFQPRQTVYLVSGADEEVSGLRGAKAIAQLLESRKVRLDFVLDEGLFIAQGLLPGLSHPVGLIGVAEKGYVSVVVKTRGVAGHASAPPPPGQTAIAKMAAALQKLDQNQLPSALQGVGREMFETLAPEMSGFQRVALSNLWLFGPIVKSQLEKAGSTNSMLRTTTSLTIVKAGNKDNVIPGQAEAVVNFRIMPGETRQSVMKHVRDTVGAEVDLEELDGATDPTGISPTQAPAYQQLSRTLRSLYPDVLLTPALFVAGSDSHHFEAIADNIYRFSPVHIKPEDLPRLHGTNERLAVSNLAELVRFYYQLLKDSASPAS
ncbi:MAG: peptidase [Rhizobacter sp.]|nr:peptidase [Rhizobacter sp.]